jgi:hypothetical protein
MAKNATSADAALILKLYNLRREPEMRKARNWFTSEFWPDSADDYIKIANSPASPENAWLRQVGSYWDMAAAFVLHGALNEDLFVQPGCSGEMFFIFGKIYPFLKELRQKTNNPTAWSNIEGVATGSKAARKRLELTMANLEKRRQSVGKTAKKN